MIKKTKDLYVTLKLQSIMVDKSKNLREIVKDTVGFGVIVYPAYAGITALLHSEPFLEKLTDENVVYFTVSFLGGRALYDIGKKFYQSRREKDLFSD